MNRKAIMTVLLTGLLCASTAVTSQALESDVKKFVRGTVIEITPEHIVIREENAASDEINQFELAINEETAFKEDTSNEDISQGDSVEIEYKETDSGKVAVLINETAVQETADAGDTKMQ